MRVPAVVPFISSIVPASPSLYHLFSEPLCRCVAMPPCPCAVVCSGASPMASRCPFCRAIQSRSQPLPSARARTTSCSRTHTPPSPFFPSSRRHVHSGLVASKYSLLAAENAALGRPPKLARPLRSIQIALLPVGGAVEGRALCVFLLFHLGISTS